MAERTKQEQQLALIAEVATIARETWISWWLRGGWAMEFFFGRISRPHEDIDLFIWAEDASRFVSRLRSHGYIEREGPPPAEQRNFEKAGEELHATFLDLNREGKVVTAGGRWDEAPWPEEMLSSAAVGRIEDIACPIIAPEAQVEIKRTMVRFRPDRTLRAKDQADIQRLRRGLSSP